MKGRLLRPNIAWLEYAGIEQHDSHPDDLRDPDSRVVSPRIESTLLHRPGAPFDRVPADEKEWTLPRRSSPKSSSENSGCPTVFLELDRDVFVASTDFDE